MSPFFYFSMSSWVISLTVFGASVTNLNEPPRVLAASTVAWLLPFWAAVNKSTWVKGVIMSLALLHYWMRDAHHCSGPPISKMTYTVLSWTLNSTLPYHTCYLVYFFVVQSYYLFSGLTLYVGWQDRYLAYEKFAPAASSSSPETYVRPSLTGVGLRENRLFKQKTESRDDIVCAVLQFWFAQLSPFKQPLSRWTWVS